VFSQRGFACLRRAGMGVGLSKGKLSKAMLEVLLQLPFGTTNLKDTIVFNLGLVGQMSATRDINEAWNQTKKEAVKLHPEKFILDGRNTLNWNDGSITVFDKEISSSNYKKLNEIANQNGITVNALVTKLIKTYK